MRVFGLALIFFAAGVYAQFGTAHAQPVQMQLDTPPEPQDPPGLDTEPNDTPADEAHSPEEMHQEGQSGDVAHGVHEAATEGQEGGHGEGHSGGHDDPPSYIMHHLSDGLEYEFEVPLGSGHNPKIDLATAFAFLRFETQPGACPTEIHESGSLSAGCIDLRPTKHVFMMWLAAFLLLVSLLVGTNRDKKQLVPHGASQNLFEMLILFVRDEMAVKNIGKEEADRYTPYLATAFFFILFMNLLGLFPWMATATSNLAITCGLALCTFFVTQYAGIRSAGLGGYLKHLTGGVAWWLWPIMIPVETLGLFTKPFALTVRLFANMLAGHLVIFFLLGLIFIIGHPGVALVSVPFALGIYVLELFVAFVQAYVFTMLSSLFIGMSVAMGHHHDHDHNGDGHADHPEGAHAHDHGVAHH
jgi:F-type H+-transporting ATPase subunit a